MRHEVVFDDQFTITVTIKEVLNSKDADEISRKVIEIISTQDNYLSIILDVTDGRATDYMPILNVCLKLAPYLDKFYKCYVIGSNENNIIHVKKLFDMLKVSEDNIFFYDEISEAQQHIKDSRH